MKASSSDLEVEGEVGAIERAVKTFLGALIPVVQRVLGSMMVAASFV